jgi:TonB family protein
MKYVNNPYFAWFCLFALVYCLETCQQTDNSFSQAKDYNVAYAKIATPCYDDDSASRTKTKKKRIKKLLKSAKLDSLFTSQEDKYIDMLNLEASPNDSIEKEDFEEIACPHEQDVEFIDGKKALQQWLQQNLIYPDICREQCIEGRVLVKFIVEKDGCIYTAQIEKKGNYWLDNEALRLVLLMPHWKPAKRRGNAYRTHLTLPIVFQLQ